MQKNIKKGIFMKKQTTLAILAIMIIIAISISACEILPTTTTTTTTPSGSSSSTSTSTSTTTSTSTSTSTSTTTSTGTTTVTDKDDPDGPAEITDIVITGAKTEFAFAEDFSADGIEVVALMSNDTERALSEEEYTVTSEDFNSMKTGTYEVQVKVTGIDISKTYEVTVSPADRLKVLMIGNSFADDTINYAYEIAKSVGIPVENILVADIYIGGCVLDTHWANAQSNAAAYRFGLEKEGWFDGTSYTNWTMEQAIKYADWDFITFQQGSSASGDPSSFGNLQNLMNYVYGIATDEENNPNANPNVKFVWHQTWAYQQGTTAAHFSKYNFDQMTMYNAIVSCMEDFILNKDFVAIIPNGTAIQNARTSLIGDTFSRDEHNHLTYGAGRYIASMNLVSVLTGIDMSDLAWKPTDSGFNYSLSETEINICKESVANAIANPFEVTKSKYPPAPTNLSDMFEGEGTEQNPYLIQSAEDMWALSNFTKGKSFTDTNTYFKLTADIDLSADNWNPICSSNETGWVDPANSFNANFDGAGHTITFRGNYTGDTWAKGLFSAVGGYVHDLILRGEITTEMGRVGSLASMARAGARIENVVSYVNITAGNNQIGGIVGYIAEFGVKITNCENYGTITGRELVGGIVGGSWTDVTYENCANHGSITATTINVGGIVAEKFAAATLTNCTNDGTVTSGSSTASSDVGNASNGYAGNLFGHEYN